MKSLVTPLTRGAGAPFALLLALAVLAHPMDATAQDLDLTGDWVLTVESPNGTGTRGVTLVQDGDDLTGEISSSRAAGELAGTVDGDVVTFVALLMMDSGPFEVTYSATIENGVMTGTVDFGSYGSGTFTGVRAESGPGLR